MHDYISNYGIIFEEVISMDIKTILLKGFKQLGERYANQASARGCFESPVPEELINTIKESGQKGQSLAKRKQHNHQ